MHTSALNQLRALPETQRRARGMRPRPDAETSLGHVRQAVRRVLMECGRLPPLFPDGM